MTPQHQHKSAIRCRTDGIYIGYKHCKELCKNSLSLIYRLKFIRNKTRPQNSFKSVFGKRRRLTAKQLPAISQRS